MITTGFLYLIYAVAQLLLVIPPIHLPDLIHEYAQYFGDHLQIFWFVLPQTQIQLIFDFTVVIMLPLIVLRIGLWVHALFRGNNVKIV